MTTPIESLPNLGPKSSRWLRDAGITSIADLEQIGAVAAYRMVKERQPKTSLNLLWALAAGLTGQDWNALSATTKQTLLEELEEV